MPDHVHLITVPPSEKALSQSIGEAHRRYMRRVNFREGWRGHPWQGVLPLFPSIKPICNWPHAMLNRIL
ncbi:hypothetical protein [Candidatus Brocadia sinica]|uniref:hypothetical protein n=1 Tax=Candidatus Brocadia TaxID=380240 RepID=UPI001910E159